MMTHQARPLTKQPIQEASDAFLFRAPHDSPELPDDHKLGYRCLKYVVQSKEGGCVLDERSQPMMMLVPPGCLGLAVVTGGVPRMRAACVFAPTRPGTDLKFFEEFGLYLEEVQRVPPAVHLVVGADPKSLNSAPQGNGAVFQSGMSLLMKRYGTDKIIPDLKGAAEEIGAFFRKEVRIPEQAFHTYQAKPGEMLEFSQSIRFQGRLRLLGVKPDKRDPSGIAVRGMESNDEKELRPTRADMNEVFLLRQYQAEVASLLRAEKHENDIAAALSIPASIVWNWAGTYRHFRAQKAGELSPAQWRDLDAHVDADMILRDREEP